MRRMILATIAALALAPMAFASSTEALSTLSVVHGIPGLPGDVDVSINDEYAFSFGFAESVGPVTLEPGTYKFKISFRGADVLSTEAMLDPGVSYSLIAHLLEQGGLAMSIFKNNVDPIAPFETRIAVRHLAQAPPVDVVLTRELASSSQNELVATIVGLKNLEQFGPAEIPAGPFQAVLTPEGQRDIELGRLQLMPGVSYAVNAIGVYPDSFQLFIQAFRIESAPVPSPWTSDN